MMNNTTYSTSMRLDWQSVRQYYRHYCYTWSTEEGLSASNNDLPGWM